MKMEVSERIQNLFFDYVEPSHQRWMNNVNLTEDNLRIVKSHLDFIRGCLILLVVQH
jgi:hypothetical protein